MQRYLIKIGSRIFPQLLVNLAYHKLANPQIRKLRSHELEILEKAVVDTVDFRGFQIKTYRWGDGEKKILLVHGWEGQAGNFSDLVELLVSNQYTVYSFDGPSHGFSSRGKTSLFEFSDLVVEQIRKHEISRIVSHSFGGVATVFALYRNQDLQIDKYALLTTPDRFLDRINDVSHKVGISNGVKNRLINRIEREYGFSVGDLNVSDFAEKTGVKKALIIHDREDKVVSIAQSRNVQSKWSVCDFEEIKGTGHFRILRTPSVLDRVVDFLES